ncbi:hypothetical protein NQZ68_008503, partial [Dissostichus eleginoides]
MSADPPVSECSKSNGEHVVSLPDLPSSVSKGDWVRSQKDDSSLSALWTEFLPEEKFRDVAQGYFVQEGLPGLILASREVVQESTGFSP